MKRRSVIIAASVVTAAILCARLASCNLATEGESPFPDRSITSTVLDGNGSYIVVTTDKDDWNIHVSPRVLYTVGTRQLDPRISPAFPNPAADSVSVIFTLGRATIPGFDIYNEKGSLVRSFFRDTLPAGTHKFTWHLEDGNGHRLPQGFYRCVYRWQTTVCDSPPGTPCNPIDAGVSGHGDISIGKGAATP